MTGRNTASKVAYALAVIAFGASLFTADLGQWPLITLGLVALAVGMLLA